MNDPVRDHIDVVTKATIPIGLILYEDLNMSCDIVQTDSFGWLHNGTFNGAMGLFERQRIKSMLHGMVMLAERLRVSEFTAEIYRIKFVTIGLITRKWC